MKKYIYSYLFIFLILTIIPTTLTASSKITLENNVPAYNDFKMQYMELSPEQLLKINDVLNLSFSQEISNAISLGYNTNEFWFHFSVHNDTDETKDMVLEFTEIIHKKLDLYVKYVKTDHIIHMKSGLTIPVSQRDIKESNPVFSLKFLPNETKELYVNLASIYGVFGAFNLKTQEQFKNDMQLTKYIYVAYLSAIIVILLYNLIIFFYLHEKIYLYYIGYVSVFILWAANYKGVLLPYTDMQIYDLLQMTIPIFFTLLIFFSQSILETKRHFKVLHRILNGFIVVCVVSLIWMSISMHSGFHFLNIAAAPLLPFLLIVAFWAVYNNLRIAKIYLIALSIYIVGMILLSLLALGILPYSIALSHAAMIGSIFEIIMFSLLLAYRINTIRQESLQSQDQLLKQQQTESTRLFHTVAEKTKALNYANKKLEAELVRKDSLEKHLQYLASTDTMTGLLNRRAFFDICDEEMIDASSNGTKLTCLIVDIDFFKKINDTYGHDMGDKVIKIVATLMIENTRTIDFVGRIGGEEFAILMPKTDKEDAFQIADRLRENIAKHEILLNNDTVHITVSIGLSYLNSEDKNIHTLLKRADTALYDAKDSGRNQVCSI